jgi:hypothetical protein
MLFCRESLGATIYLLTDSLLLAGTIEANREVKTRLLWLLVV